MKKRSIAVVALSALAMGALLMTFLPASGQEAVRSFTLCEKDSHDYEITVDNRAKGFSPGDQFIFAEPEFNEDGNRVGRTIGTATVIKTAGQRDAIVQFNVSINLQAGSIEVQAARRFSDLGGGKSLAIIGGTGNYRDATGVVKIYGQPCDGVGDKGDHLKVLLDI